MPEVLVVGGSGFVGQFVLRELAARALPVTALVRGDGEIALGVRAPAIVPSFDVLPTRSFDVVVNLAYPTSGDVATYRRQTEDLMAGIDRVVTDGGRLVQVSTQAAFGLALDRAVVLGQAPRVRDVPYVEAKLAAEQLASRISRRRAVTVDIARLGNVGGGAGWTQQIVTRLATGRPTFVEGIDGPSNITDVANAASYIGFLAESVVDAPALRFHHLAEFSAVPWSAWIGPLADALGVEPTTVPASSLTVRDVRGELGEAFGPFSPLRIYRTLRNERVMGSWMRTLRGFVPDRLAPTKPAVEPIYAAPPALDADDVTFLAIVSSLQEFKTSVNAGWEPPLSFDDSIARALDWLRRDWDI